MAESRARKSQVLNRDVQHGHPLMFARAAPPMAAKEPFAAVFGWLGTDRCAAFAQRAKDIARAIFVLSRRGFGNA
jgi:hypothetical protein